jgi:hypothetical protein
MVSISFFSAFTAIADKEFSIAANLGSITDDIEIVYNCPV